MKTFKAVFIGVLLSLSIGVQAAGTQVQENATAATVAAGLLSHTITSTTTNGNIGVMGCAVDKDATGFTAPSGWTEGVTPLVSADVSLAVYYKTLDGTETEVTCDWTTGTARLAAVHFIEYSGIDTFDKAASDPSGGDTCSKTSGTTLAKAESDSRGIAYFASDSGANVNTGIGYTNTYLAVDFLEAAAGGAPGLGIADKDINAAGTEETTYSCTGGGDNMASAILVFNNSGGGPAGATIPIIRHHNEQQVSQ